MKKAYNKDILRTIKKNFKRFVALAVITALGLTAYAGITAAVHDLYKSADQLYTKQQLFDVRILSTLGLTEEDVKSLGNLDVVDTVEGGYRENVQVVAEDDPRSATVQTIKEQGLNQPFVLEGQLPSRKGEVAVTRHYLNQSGKSIGDTLEIKEEATGEDDTDKPNFLATRFTITGLVIDPADISNNESAPAIRSNSDTDYTFYVSEDSVHSDVFTTVFLTIKGTNGMDSYADPYKEKVQTAIDAIETQIMDGRQQARYDSVTGEAWEKVNDAQLKMDDEFAKADKDLADGWKKIEDSKKEVADGKAELTQQEQTARTKFAEARDEIASNKAQLEQSQGEIPAKEAELALNVQKLEEGQKELDANRQTAEAGFKTASEAFTSSAAELNETLDSMKTTVDALRPIFKTAPSKEDLWPTALWDALVEATANAASQLILQDPQNPPDFGPKGNGAAMLTKATTKEQKALVEGIMGCLQSGMIIPANMDASAFVQQCVQTAMGYGATLGGLRALDVQQAAFETQKAGALQQLAEAQTEIDNNALLLEQGRQQLENGKTQIANGWKALAEGEATLNSEEISANEKIAQGWQDLADGETKLQDGIAEYDTNKAKYLEEKADAQQKIADAKAKIEDIRMTQWYVQDRTALDSFSGLDSELSSIGAIGKAFPVLFLVVAVLISLTTMTRMVEEERGLIGTYKALGLSNFAIGKKYVIYALLASVVGSIVGSVFGFIILPQMLIKILSTVYIIPETRLFFDWTSGLIGTLLFTVSIVVATALACRNELRQTPAALMRPKTPRAGSRILLERIPFVWNRLGFLNKVTARNLFRYKKRLIMTIVGIAACTALVLAGFAIRDSVQALIPSQYGKIYRYDLMVVANNDKEAKLIKYLKSDSNVQDFIPVQLDTIKAFNEKGASEALQLVVIPKGQSLDSYIQLPTIGAALPNQEDGIRITQNAAEILDLKAGDTLTIQTTKLERFEVKVAGVVEHYLGNNLYIPQELYEASLTMMKANAAYVHLGESVTDPGAYADSLGEKSFVMSSISTDALKDQFTSDFSMLNTVILILLILAAALAFVVLFTLSSTNISERERELATIKVLGFYDREVHSYVNKEVILLTLLGALVGLPLGNFLSGLLLDALKMPSLEFVLVIQPYSYVLAGVIAFSFSLLVNLITNKTLNKINMVEALKSVE